MGIRRTASLWAAFAAFTAFWLPVALPWSGGAQAGDKSAMTQRKGSGLPIPRFASVRSDEANVRTGPGTRYPVEWVFKRKSMPVEIVAEYENWRKIRDWQGASCLAGSCLAGSCFAGSGLAGSVVSAGFSGGV